MCFVELFELRDLNRTRFLWTPTSLTIASNQEGGHGEETGPHPESTSNAEWLIARLGYQTPAAARATAWAEAA
jgi:hypothetical protein